MCKRFVDIIQFVRAGRCAIALLVSIGILFTSSSSSLAQAADTSEKPKSGKAMLEKKCEIPDKYKKKWTEPEKWAWKEICAGRVANLNGERRAKVLNPINPKREILDFKQSKYDEKFLAKRTLSSRFLRTILKTERFFSVDSLRGVWIMGAYFQDNIDLSGLSIERSLTISHSRSQSGIVMRHFKASERAAFIASSFEGDIRIDTASFDDTLSIINVRFDSLSLKDTKINGDLVASLSAYNSEFDMDVVSIKGDLYMARVKFFHVALKRVKVDGFFNMSDSKFKGKFDTSSLTVGDDLLMRDAQFDEPVMLESLTIQSDLDMRGATLSGLDLTGARITGNLRLGYRCKFDRSSCKDKEKKKIIWKNYIDSRKESHPPKLTLRNASFGSIINTGDAWPPDLELNGFTYKRFESDESKTLSERGSDWFINWLAKDESYSPQPYLQLAGVLRNTGLGTIADDILYQNRDEQRADKKTQRFEWWRLSFLRWVYGYGYGRHIFWALLQLAMILIASGTFVIYIYITERRDRDLIISGFRDSFWYSVDMLLPVMKLREKHYEIDLETKPVRYYFHCHQIMGYLLIFFVIAGLTGLTK